MLLGEGKKQWRQWVNQVSVVSFNSGKYYTNMVKKYFIKEISYNKEYECNEGVFAAVTKNLRKTKSLNTDNQKCKKQQVQTNEQTLIL